MAKGWDNVEAAARAAAEQRAQFEQSSLPQLFVGQKNPGPYIGRFLEQGPDVNSYAVHEYQVPDPSAQGGFRRKRFTCLSEAPWNAAECPGCKAGLKRKIRGVYNFIQRNRPILRKGADGKAIKANGEYIVDGHADDVVILNVPSTTADMLRQKDGHYQGLMTGDVQVSYSNNTFQPLTVEPANVAQFASPLTENDQALLARKHDLDKFMEPPSFQEAAQIVAKFGGNSGAAPQPTVGGVGGAQGNAGVAGAANGFLAGANVPAGGVNAFGATAPAAPAPAAAAAAVPAVPVTPQQAVEVAGAQGTGQPVVPVIDGNQPPPPAAVDPAAAPAAVPPPPAPVQQ